MRAVHSRSGSAYARVLTAIAMAIIPAVPVTADELRIDVADYPSLDGKELGHVRRIVELARQLPGDSSGMGDDVWHAAERTKQFQLQYMAAAIALVQHQYTPAYRELYKQTIDELIQKMTLPDIWETWMDSSRAGTSAYGGVPADPDATDLEEGWLDPVRKHNVMLRGPLIQAAGLYEMLYRDGRYLRADAFTFRYMAGTWGNGPVVFRYSLPDLVKITYDEFVAANYQGVLCEPNRFFPQCNQPPILGLINFDQISGTAYAADVMPKFAAAWKRAGYTDPQTRQNIGWLLVKQKQAGGGGGPDGWTGPWMYVWNPDFVRPMYQAQRERFLDRFLTGEYARQVPEFAGKDLLSLGYGLFAFWAAEMGDHEAREKLIAYADRNFNPVWQDGAYYYPRSLDYQADADGNSHGVSSWTGNVLIALARLDKGDGFLELYRTPWGEAQLRAPQVTGVDYLTTNVSQAYYDSKKDALIVTLEPGPVKASRVQFNVVNLDRRQRYRVMKDGKLMAELSTSAATRTSNLAVDGAGVLTIDTSLDSPHSFVILARRAH